MEDSEKMQSDFETFIWKELNKEPPVEQVEFCKWVEPQDQLSTQQG